MAAGIFGALGALADTAGQVAEGKQLAHDEIVRRLAARQAQQTATLNQQRIRQQIAASEQTMKLGQQPVAVGNPYVSGGKTYQRMQNPLTGEFSVKELPGGLPETKIEGNYRGLKALGLSDEEAAKQAIKISTGKQAEKREVVPDAASLTGWSAVYSDGEGQEIWRMPGIVPPRQAGQQVTTRDTTDPVTGLTTHSVTTRAPKFTAPPGTPSTALPAVRSAIGLPAPSASQGGAPGATAGSNSGPVTPPTGRAKPAATTAGTGTTAIGPYKGIQLTEDGRAIIPPRPGVTESERQAAQQLINGADINKIYPAKLRPLAASIASKYGWKGQGGLTPAQQMQIQQVDNALATMNQDKYMKLFDSTWNAIRMAGVPLDPTGEGGFAGMMAALNRRTISDDDAQFMDDLTRLRGVITGIRSFTGANNSNATADRLLAELNSFTNSKNSKDARYKLSRLQNEVNIIKKLGYFLPGETPAPPNTTTKADASADDEATRLLRENGVIQ